MRWVACRTFPLIAVCIGCLAGNARADEIRWHANAGLTLPVFRPQSREFGLGAGATAVLEIPIAKVLGIQAEIGGLTQSKGDPPANPLILDHSSGAALFGTLGARYRPLGARSAAGWWLDLNFGYARTGTRDRPTLDAHVGYDWRMIALGPRWDLGPFVGYTQIFQPGGTLRPEDAHIVWAGVHFGLGAREEKVAEAAPVIGDSDKDTVFDDEDACPDEPGLRSRDVRTNGCPRPDRDKDTVFDDEDACPDEPGIRTGIPRTNGCAPLDRDSDDVYDDEDRCPDVPGVRSTDPKVNGCPPADRDNDTVFDVEDACPDVPGVRSADTKTNGCPATEGHVRVEGDKILLDDVILFENNSPRVRHVSWAIVKKVAEFINKNPDVLEFDIEGHADETGTVDHNLMLSRERAASVKRLLVQYSVDGARITTHAYGYAAPKVSGHTEEQRAQNRRVEFTIVKARPMQTAPTPAPVNEGTP